MKAKFIHIYLPFIWIRNSPLRMIKNNNSGKGYFELLAKLPTFHSHYKLCPCISTNEPEAIQKYFGFNIHSRTVVSRTREGALWLRALLILPRVWRRRFTMVAELSVWSASSSSAVYLFIFISCSYNSQNKSWLIRRRRHRIWPFHFLYGCALFAMVFMIDDLLLSRGRLS